MIGICGACEAQSKMTGWAGAGARAQLQGPEMASIFTFTQLGGQFCTGAAFSSYKLGGVRFYNRLLLLNAIYVPSDLLVDSSPGKRISDTRIKWMEAIRFIMTSAWQLYRVQQRVN